MMPSSRGLAYLRLGSVGASASSWPSSSSPHPKTARRGNLLGAAGMALVVMLDLLHHRRHVRQLVDPADRRRLIGAVMGVLGARRVPMTAMPQMVAIFNGAGGGAAAVVAIAEFMRDTGEHPDGTLACRS